MLLGGTAAVYAMTLAAVSALQASSDASLAAARQPFLDRVAATRAANDELEDALGRAHAIATRLTGEYDALSLDVATYEERLAALAALVADVEGSAAALPARISLPKVTMRGTVGTTRSSSGGSSSGAPSSNGSTGGSGG
jgi:hypothetical protein